MGNFKQFCVEADQTAEKAGATQAISQLGGELSVANVKQLVQQSGAKTVDEFIDFLKGSPQVKKVVDLYRKGKSKQEHVIGEGVGAWIQSGLASIGSFFLKGAVSMLRTIFMLPFSQETSTGEKLVYAAGLAAIFLASPILVGLAAPEMGVAGAASAVSSTFIPGFNLAWWVIEAFMHTFFKPFIQQWENPTSEALDDAEQRLQNAIDDGKKQFVSPGGDRFYGSWHMKKAMKRR